MRHIAILIIFLSCNVFASDQVMTVCYATKNTYVHISPYNSVHKQDETTNYITEEKETGETYTLLLENNKINIHYKSKKYPALNWSMNERLSRDNGELYILNKDPRNLILRTHYTNQQEQVYYFNLDDNINGYLTIVSTRWNSFLDCANNQSLEFYECKGIIK
tara:strand:- start:84 stop:572 length:489 start_codon:yes stop_codon:yes gene_type:complete